MSLPPDLDSVVAGKIYVVGSIVLPVASLDVNLGVLIAYSLTPLPTNSFPGGPSACYMYIYSQGSPTHRPERQGCACTPWPFRWAGDPGLAEGPAGDEFGGSGVHNSPLQSSLVLHAPAHDELQAQSAAAEAPSSFEE